MTFASALSALSSKAGIRSDCQEAHRGTRGAAETERESLTGIRDEVTIMIGGAPVTDSFCKQIGADIYTPDAASAAEAAVKAIS